jgi:shikimate kinase
MLIYLVGFMGCGKSKIGKELARNLKYDFVDLDDVIEKKSGKKIMDIFKDDGQPAFRNLEAEILKNISTLDDSVVSTGGGTACFNDNMILMNETGTTIYIQMSAGALFHRLAQAKKKRPLIAGLNDVELMEYILDKMAEREYFYTQAKFAVKGENLKAAKMLEVLNIK